MLAIKILKSSFAEIDGMELDTLLDVLNVYDKINGEDEKQVFIDDIL